jgi:1-acyl-sn-glycerol-3-phosphate acyltransferase
VTFLRVAWRAWRVFVHLLRGLATIMWRFPRLTPAQRDLRVQAWAAAMLLRLGVTLEVHGTAPAIGPMLLVCNHVSWLDIIVLHAAHHCRFVSKADVGRWPIVGRLATGAGTLYIERSSRRDAMRVVHDMVQALHQGDILMVFPEGTTGDGDTLLPFHANLIQAAVSAPAPVQPVALRYEDADGANSRAVSYVGDETLVGSVWRTLQSRGLRATVRFGQAQQHDGRDRRGWARDLRMEVARLGGWSLT